MQVTDKLGGPFTPPGFYYKTFIRPRKAWPLYEKLLRSAAGLGELDPTGARDYRVDVENRHVDVLVVGGGQAGLAAAIEHAGQGRHVTVVDEGPEAGGALLGDPAGAARAGELRTAALAAGVELLAPAIAIGLFEYNFVPVQVGNLLVKFRAGTVVIAAGIVEQPLVFPGNDLVGVVLPEAVRRFVNCWSIKPAERAAVITADDRGLAAADDLRAAGVDVPLVLDLREGQPPNIEASGRRGRVTGVTVNGASTACDLLVMSGSPQPNVKLLAQAGAGSSTTPRAGSSSRPSCRRTWRPSGRPPGTSASRPCPKPCSGTTATSASSASARTRPRRTSSTRSTRGSTRSSSRSGTRPSRWGPARAGCAAPTRSASYAKAKGVDENTIGTTTARPPYTPVPMGLVAGYPEEPGEAHVAPPPPQGPRRQDDVDRSLAPTALVHRRPGRRGAERPRGGRADRRLDARQDPRPGPGRRCVPRPRVPESLLRPEGRPRPLRRAHGRRGSDHGRRHRRSPRRPDLLRDDELDRGGRRLPVVHVVERRVVHGRPVRQPHRGARGDQRRRPEGPGAHAATLRRRLLQRGARVPGREARDRRGRPDASPCASGSSGSSATSCTCRARSPSTSGTRSSTTAPISGSRRSGSSRSGSSGSRRAT